MRKKQAEAAAKRKADLEKQRLEEINRIAEEKRMAEEARIRADQEEKVFNDLSELNSGLKDILREQNKRVDTIRAID